MIQQISATRVQDRLPCKMALADGTVITGISVGHKGETGGELCFNTSMTGYQEILSDPSYFGQIMMMTYPHIGNYGTKDDDMEAARPMVAGLAVRAFSESYSNPLARSSLATFMCEHELVGISGIDTRSLVRHIRTKGVMNAVISSLDLDDDSLLMKARAWPSMEGLELATRVSVKEPYDFSDFGRYRVAVYDYGVKRHILRSLEALGCRVRVFPVQTDSRDVLAWEPDGVFFSNGPGDPRAMLDAVAAARSVLETDIPVFGICLGHQILSLASGLDVYKMYVGHRGANHPVKNLITGRVEVSTQNHGFAVTAESISTDVAAVTHVNLNDSTVEGLRFTRPAAFSIQYHPEASPGPHDSQYLFGEFIQDIHERQAKHVSPQSAPSVNGSTTTDSEPNTFDSNVATRTQSAVSASGSRAPFDRQ